MGGIMHIDERSYITNKLGIGSCWQNVFASRLWMVCIYKPKVQNEVEGVIIKENGLNIHRDAYNVRH